jgi:hypothetical protein
MILRTINFTFCLQVTSKCLLIYGLGSCADVFVAVQNVLQWFICYERGTIRRGIAYCETADRIFNYKEYFSEPARSISHNSKKHFYSAYILSRIFLEMSFL